MHKAIDIQAGSMLLVDKPEGWTSFDVVNKIRFALRRSFQVKKIKVGHAGTLDPAATGLLIVCIGKMTKQISTFQDLEKTYEGTIILGATTPTFDRESDIDQTYPIHHISELDVKNTAPKFIGAIDQKPPIYSAIKKDGVRLYHLARKNKQVDIPSRPVVIHQFHIVEVDLPQVGFKVVCSKGTYIRSLAYDFGRALESGAYLGALRRTAIGEYSVADAWNLDDLIIMINTMSHEHSR